MRLTWDPSCDAAYLYLVDRRERGMAQRTVPLQVPGCPSEMFLDFGADAKLVGVEILDASLSIPKEALDQAITPASEEVPA
jgi:uncharacterized protein YuzE